MESTELPLVCLINQFGNDFIWNGEGTPYTNHKVTTMIPIEGHTRDIYNMDYDMECLQEYDIILVNCSLHDWSGEHEKAHSDGIQNTERMMQWTIDLKYRYPDKIIGITPEGTAGSVDRTPIHIQELWYKVVNVIDFLLIYEIEAASYYQSFTTKPIYPLYFYPPPKEFYDTVDDKEKRDFQIIFGFNDFIAGKNSIGTLLAYKELKKQHPDLKAKMIFAAYDNRRAISNLLKTLEISDVMLLRQAPWALYMKYLSSAYIGLHLEQTITAGRFPLDCAMSGLPCVSTHATNQLVLYPSLSVKPFDTEKAIELCNKLIDDSEFYDYVTQSAHERIDGRYTEEWIRSLFVQIYSDHSKNKTYTLQTSPIVKESHSFVEEQEKPFVRMYDVVPGLTSVCINTWNHLEQYSKPCIESVIKYTNSNYELVICDNASTDGTVEYLQSLEHPNLTLILNDTNTGCPGGRNSMMQAAKGEYLAILDYDVLIQGFKEDGIDWIRYTLNIMESVGVQAAGPLLEYEPILDFWYLVDAVVIYHHSVPEKIGLYDERFAPYGYDNADYGYRMKKAGISITPFSGLNLPVAHPGWGDEQWTTDFKVSNADILRETFKRKWIKDIKMLDDLYPNRDMNRTMGIVREGGPIY